MVQSYLDLLRLLEHELVAVGQTDKRDARERDQQDHDVALDEVLQFDLVLQVAQAVAHLAGGVRHLSNLESERNKKIAVDKVSQQTTIRQVC